MRLLWVRLSCQCNPHQCLSMDLERMRVTSFLAQVAKSASSNAQTLRFRLGKTKDTRANLLTICSAEY